MLERGGSVVIRMRENEKQKQKTIEPLIKATIPMLKEAKKKSPPSAQPSGQEVQ